MNIGKVGFIPTTLIDYPGEVASVIFLPGCNFKCPYCHNPSLALGLEDETLVDIEDALDKIRTRRKQLTGVVITGGEPTLYRDLPQLIEKIKDLDLKVKLDTNGSFPKRLEGLRADYIAMDLKTSPGKYFSLGLDDFSKIEESIKTVINSGIDFEFRTTAAPIIFTESDLKDLLPYIKLSKRYFITGFKQGNILNKEYNNNSPYSEDELKRFREICLDAGVSCTIR